MSEQRPAETPRRPKHSLRPLLLRLHFYAGVFVAPFLLVAAVTGLLYTATPQLERLVHGDVLTVPASERSVPLSEQVQAARAAVPDGTITKVRVAATPTESTRVVLATDDVKEGYGFTVFVDPHDGRVLGTAETYGDWLPVRALLDDLHRTLLLGETGRLYSELAASWLWVIALGGLALWWQRRRRTRQSLRRPGTGRRRLVALHGAIGVTIIAGLLVLSATGLTWSKHAGENVAQLRADLSLATPVVDTGGPAGGGDHAGHGGAAPAASEPARVAELDRVGASAQRAGLQGPLDITLPTADGGRFQVKENKRSWPVRQDSIAVDGASGEVTDTLRFADWPLGAKLARWGIDGHMGLLFGIANQVVLR